MVRGMVQDGEGAVELFGEEGAYELVGEGHARKRKHGIGPGIDFAGETVGASHDETYPSGTAGEFSSEPRGELHRAHLRSLFVEQYDVVARRCLSEYHLSFGLFLYLYGQFPGVADVGKKNDGESGVSADAFRIVRHEGGYLRRVGFAYEYEVYSHGCLLLSPMPQRCWGRSAGACAGQRVRGRSLFHSPPAPSYSIGRFGSAVAATDRCGRG